MEIMGEINQIIPGVNAKTRLRARCRAWHDNSMSNDIQINERVSIPEKELKFKFSRSPGPGGQHVNTAATKVTVFFNIDKTRSLTQLQKVSVKGKLRRRIDGKGVLQVSAHDFRSQQGNRKAAVDRFVELMQWALKPVTPRKATMPSLSSIRKQKQSKARRSQTKRMRKSPKSDGDW